MLQVAVLGGTRAGWKKVWSAKPPTDWTCPKCDAHCKFYWRNCPNCGAKRED